MRKLKYLLSVLLAFSMMIPYLTSGNSLALADNPQSSGTTSQPYQVYNGHHPTNEERDAAASAALVARVDTRTGYSA